MNTVSLQSSAAALVRRLGDRVEETHGFGFMSVAIYDTAWVSIISKREINQTIWLFPECFEYILCNQLSDGGWPMYASEIDGILNTAASLLSLKRHHTNPYQITSITQDDVLDRIKRAKSALDRLLNAWDVASTLHVGFEILVPALLRYLEKEDITFTFPGKDLLLKIESEKISKFKPQFLYLPIKSTALHSLEAFVGAIDFDKVSHHKVNGSFMASPSSTAAFMIHSSKWDYDCEIYIRHVIQHASGGGSGGVPSAFPSPIFELTWPLSTLLKAGFDLKAELPSSIKKIGSYLYNVFATENGIVGFTPFVGPDADDTANTILVLGLLDQPVSPDSMLQTFEDEHHFKTYPLERNPSFSANCNVLNALLYTPDPSIYTSQIEKATRFLYGKFIESDLNVQDKWNLSPYYSWMLMAQAISRLVTLKSASQLPAIPDDLINKDLTNLLMKISSKVLSEQNSNGSWGCHSSKEETAYALLVLTHAHTLLGVSESNSKNPRTAIKQGSTFILQESSDPSSEWLWVEKVTYRSEILAESYILAAVKKATELIGDYCSAELVHFPSNGIQQKATISIERNGHVSTDENEPMKANRVKENGIENIHIEEANSGTENGVQNQNSTRNVYAQKETSKILEANASCDMDGRSIHVNGYKDMSYYNRSEWSASQEQILLGPFDYLENLPGKNIRSRLIHAFNIWLNIPPESLKIIEKIIGMLHTASLLVDDIQDQSLLRRGQPVAHSIFGTAQTLNSGNYIYFLALREVQKLQNPKAINIYVSSLIDLHRGQGMELFWRDSLICPTEDEYLDMVANKTGGLFCLAVQLMQAEAPIMVELVPLVRLLGIIFQICDDYLNLKSSAYADSKGLCEDLTEGKFSFPIIHSIRVNPGNRQLINILKQKPREDDIKRYAISYMESTKSFEYTRDVVNKLKQEAMETIHDFESNGLDENIEIKKILARMSLES